MKEFPILFSAPMVRAIFDGHKTQTRRMIKWPTCFHAGPSADQVDNLGDCETIVATDNDGKQHFIRSPYGAAGDRLWVRENGWQRPDRTPRMMRDGADTWEPYYFDADLTASDHEQFKAWGFRRRPSIHMPRAFCRLLLDVVDLRVQRLQETSEDDAKAEGLTTPAYPPGVAPATFRRAYANLWDTLNAKRGSWNSNPWIWTVTFRRSQNA